MRLMVVGDSISQGSSGDYTWRYFLDKHLGTAAQQVDLVGHRDDLWDAAADAPGSYDYADPDFDHDHASQWGYALSWPRFGIREVAAQHSPDVVVLALGTNDLTFMQQTSAATWARVEQEVAGLREVNPDVRVVLVEVTSAHLPGASDYNQRLRTGAPTLSTPRSPVVVARAAEGFVVSSPARDGDTWDAVHPDTSGQVRIAAAVADALSGLGLGAPYPRPLQVPPDGLRRPPGLTAVAGARCLVLTWDGPPGATGHDVWLRDASAGLPWGLVRQDVPGSAHVLDGLTPGHVYGVRVRARKGFTVAASDMASNTVSVQVPGGQVPGAGRPSLPSAVQGVRVAGRRGRLLVTWHPVAGADSYLVWWRAWGGAGWETVATAGSRAAVRDLPAGATYLVRVQAVNGAGAGGFSGTARTDVAGRRPARVVRVRATVMGGNDVGVRWRPARAAGRYEVQHRRLVAGGRWRSLPPEFVLMDARVRLPDLGPGRYLVRVRGWNGERHGPWSRPATVRVEPGHE